MRFDALQKTQCLKVTDDCAACFVAVQLPIGFRGGVTDGRVPGEDIDQWQVMSQTHFIIIEVVGRRNFYAAGPKFGVYIIISDNGNFPIAEGRATVLPIRA